MCSRRQKRFVGCDASAFSTYGTIHARRTRMIVRRLMALILSGSLVHLAFARADAACASHGQGAGQGVSMMEGPAEASNHHTHANPPATDGSCDTPTLPVCCQMLASCSTVLGGQDLVRQQVRKTHATVAALPQRVPESRVATPDTPPPKL
jgi:hypothetical protein